MDESLPIDPDLAPTDAAEPRLGRTGAVPPSDRVHRGRSVVLLAIAVGGACGAAARAGLGVAFPERAGRFPWTTFTINVSGSFALGALLAILVERATPSRYLRPLVATGFIGAYTTFSTFAVGAVLLAKDGHVVSSLLSVAASLVAGLGAAWLGIVVGRR